MEDERSRFGEEETMEMVRGFQKWRRELRENEDEVRESVSKSEREM